LFEYDNRLLALGGQIGCNSETSAEAEYEALIMGLDAVRGLPNISELHLVGDCKVVLQQLSGASIPRKLRQKHQQVVDCLTLLNASVTTQWVPRTHPIQGLVDHVARHCIHLHEHQAFKAIESELDCSSRVVLERILNDNHINISQRVHLLDLWSFKAKQVNAWALVLQAGEALVMEATGWKSSTKQKSKDQNAYQIFGLDLQLDALKHLRPVTSHQIKAIQKLEHKRARLSLQRDDYEVETFAVQQGLELWNDQLSIWKDRASSEISHVSAQNVWVYF